MAISLKKVRHLLEKEVYNQAQNLANDDGMVSKTDEANHGRWSRIRSELIEQGIIEETAKRIREEKGPGGRVGVREITNAVMEELDTLWEKYNQQAGLGQHFISKAEITEAKTENDALGKTTFKAWNSILSAQKIRREPLTDDNYRLKADATELTNISDWKDLTRKQREYLIKNDWRPSNPHISFGPEQTLDQIKNPEHREYAQKIFDTLESATDNYDPGDYRRDGDFSFVIRFVTLDNGEIVGASVNSTQPLKEMDYDNPGEWLESDASIEGYGYFDFDGSDFYYEVSWE